MHRFPVFLSIIPRQSHRRPAQTFRLFTVQIHKRSADIFAVRNLYKCLLVTSFNINALSAVSVNRTNAVNFAGICFNKANNSGCCNSSVTNWMPRKSWLHPTLKKADIPPSVPDVQRTVFLLQAREYCQLHRQDSLQLCFWR